MPTANYSFPTISGTDPIDMEKAINDPLNAIDGVIKSLADKVDALEGTTYSKGTTYDDLKNHGFIYEDLQS